MIFRYFPPPINRSIPDGLRMPVHCESRPAVMFRSGIKMRAGAFAAKHWAEMDADCWVWQEVHSGFDIIAWWPEPDELIGIPRIQ